MQDFDTVIRELIDNDTITLEDGLTFATNPNNLLLSLKGVTASEEFMQRDESRFPIGTVKNQGSMLSMIE
jgi:Tfp pilus assembly ATPase PilU